MKKIISLVLTIVLSISLFACNKEVTNYSGIKESIDVSKMRKIDLSKLGSQEIAETVSGIFDISYSNPSLPSGANNNSDMSRALQNSAFGNMFLDDFINNNTPYICYEMTLKFKPEYYYDKDFYVYFDGKDFADGSGQYIGSADINSKGYTFQVKLRSSNMPTNKGSESWNTLKRNLSKYIDEINSMINTPGFIVAIRECGGIAYCENISSLEK